MILMEMMLEVVIGVLAMEVDKVADEVTNMEVDKVTNMMAEFATNTSYLAAIFLSNEGYCLLYFPMSSLNGECVDFFI